MASLQASSYISSSNGSKRNSINAAIHVPKFSKTSFSIPKSRDLFDKFHLIEGLSKPTLPIHNQESNDHSNTATARLYVILDAVADRVEMHKNIGEQRDNWNKLLLNSINMIILSASTMAGFAVTINGSGDSVLGFKLASTLLFSAATGMLIIMNKIQPSQLAEEQRNATRLFKELYTQIQTKLFSYVPTELDVKDAMEKVLALDEAFPLPLLGKMIEKFPSKFQPATWWPKKSSHRLHYDQSRTNHRQKGDNNGWNKEIEEEMREVSQVMKSKDSEDYMKLGNLALKLNKALAISGPLLTGIAAIGSSFLGNEPAAAIVAVTAGALATAVNTFEHGGQIGMQIEMYRNCGGFFANMEESIEEMLDEENLEKREDGEIFEMKVALKLGRSLSELRNLSKRSSSSRREGNDIQDFASQLF